MPDQVTTTATSLWSGLTAGFMSFMQFLPALIGGLVVLLVGWYIAKFVGRLVQRVLHALKFEQFVERSQLHSYLPQRTPPLTFSGILGTLTKWFVFLVFVQATANIWRMPQVTAIINSVLLYLPNIFISMVILVFGTVIAKMVGDIVESSVSGMKVTNAHVLSLIARYAILGFAAIAAVNQLGIATSLINILFTGLIGSLALALGLAFGLGGQGVASEITRDWYEKTTGGSRLKSIPGGGKEGSPSVESRPSAGGAKR